MESLERQIEVSMEQSAARESSKGFVTVTVLVLVETFSTIEPRMNHRGRRIPHGSFNMLRGTFRGSDSSRKSSQTRNSTWGKDFYTFLRFFLFSFFFTRKTRRFLFFLSFPSTLHFFLSLRSFIFHSR